VYGFQYSFFFEFFDLQSRSDRVVFPFAEHFLEINRLVSLALLPLGDLGCVSRRRGRHFTTILLTGPKPTRFEAVRAPDSATL